MARRSKPKGTPRHPVLPPVHPRAAGIDIGATFHVVAVPPDLSPEPVRTFRSFTGDLHRLVDWLAGLGVTTVAMESTGMYVRRITARAISLAEGTGSEGNPWVNDSPGGESQGGQQHVVEAERPRSRVWSGSARPVCYGESLVA
jgi:hypothetical protein